MGLSRASQETVVWLGAGEARMAPQNPQDLGSRLERKPPGEAQSQAPRWAGQHPGRSRLGTPARDLQQWPRPWTWRRKARVRVVYGTEGLEDRVGPGREDLWKRNRDDPRYLLE